MRKIRSCVTESRALRQLFQRRRADVTNANAFGAHTLSRSNHNAQSPPSFDSRASGSHAAEYLRYRAGDRTTIRHLDRLALAAHSERRRRPRTSIDEHRVLCVVFCVGKCDSHCAAAQINACTTNYLARYALTPP